MNTYIRRLLLCGFLGLTLWTAPVSAETPRFGYSGLFHLDDAVWDSLDLEGKKAHIDERLELATSLGATVIRLGTASPNPLARAAIELDGERDWSLADYFIQKVHEKGMLLCATLPELVKSNGLNSYKQFLTKLIERYDGDADFGVAEVDVNQEHPDVDGSGSVTFADWGADNGTKKAWAADRVLDLVEIGNQPHQLEMAGTLEKTDYALQLAAVHSVFVETGAKLKVMLGTTAADNQTQGTFQTRLEDLDPEGAFFDIASGAFDDAFSDVSGDKAIEKIHGFFDWPTSVGYPDVERWVGSLAVGGDECADARCGERLKSSLIVKGVLAALEKGYGTILYGDPIETVAELPSEGSALWTRATDSGTGWDAEYTARASADVWLKLVEIASSVQVEEIERLPSDNPLVVGFKIGTAGWLYWYNWTRQVGPGEAYSGKEFEATLAALEAPALQITTLWKEGEEADWAKDVILVADGKAKFMLGQDVVWVTTTDAPPTPEPEISDDLGGAPDKPTSPVAEDGGCSTHQGTSPIGVVILLLLLLGGRVLLRRASKRLA